MSPNPGDQNSKVDPDLQAKSATLSTNPSDLKNLMSRMNNPPMLPHSGPQDPESIPTHSINSQTNLKINCTICLKLPRTLPCCLTTRGPCSLCADFSHLLHQQLAEQRAHDEALWQAQLSNLSNLSNLTALSNRQTDVEDERKKQRQEKEDLVESLKQQTQEAEEEEKRLDRILEERKGVLRRLRVEKRVREPVQEFTIKEVKRGRKGKRRV